MIYYFRPEPKRCFFYAPVFLFYSVADQVPHDGRCLVLGRCGGVGVGGQGEARTAGATRGTVLCVDD